MMRRTFALLATIAWLAASSPSATFAAAAPASYKLTDLGVASGYTKSFAYGTSDDGSQVAGWVATDSGNTRGFVWSAATGMTLLGDATGATASRGFSVNDQGQVVGEMSYGSRREATLWTAGTPSGLGTLSNAGSSVAFAINNAGTAVGWSDSSVGTRAFSWADPSGMQSLGTLPGGTQTRAYAINASGQAAGWGTSPAGDRGFLASGGLTEIPTLSGSGRTRAFGVANANGWVTGDAQDPTFGDVAFAWSSTTGTVVSLGLIKGAARSFGADINSSGTAVGWADGLPSGEQATFWTSASGMWSLDSLLVGAAGWSVQRARSITDDGVIVGNAVNVHGQVHAVLLTPVPETSTWLMLSAGLLGVGWARRRIAVKTH